MEIKIDDIIFWVLILAIIGVALWLLVGSPTEMSAIISVAIFTAGSEIYLWRTLFEKEKNSCIEINNLDKKTAVSFEKVRSDIRILKQDINHQFKEI